MLFVEMGLFGEKLVERVDILCVWTRAERGGTVSLETALGEEPLRLEHVF